MSNIYIQEPPTEGKVLLHTSVGDIDVELWSRECPRACRNFVQLCMEGYYDGTTFHRVVKDFIAQGGDPTNTGDGGESIYERPFRDEFHSRLRFNRRGLVACAGNGNQNGSQFFFTLDKTLELNNKHTIFGKVSGNTIYNMIKLNEAEVDSDNRPADPHKIVSAEILSNPFEDIKPRKLPSRLEVPKEEKKKATAKATKNFNLLSFGEEAEEDEGENEVVSKELSAKPKSSHDAGEDPTLLAEAGPDMADEDRLAPAADYSPDISTEVKQRSEEREEEPKKKKRKVKEEAPQLTVEEQIKAVKRELQAGKKAETEAVEAARNTPQQSAMYGAFLADKERFKTTSTFGKGNPRERQTMEMLKKFNGRLKQLNAPGLVEEAYASSEEEAVEGKEEEDDPTDETWMAHKLAFEDSAVTKVSDPANYNPDRYDIFDPRNPMTQRRREEGEKSGKSRDKDKMNKKNAL